MTNKTQHTPTPWTEFIPGKQFHAGICQAKSVNPIAYVCNQATYDEANENAAFIVRAVNSHEALLEITRDYQKLMEELPEDGPYLKIHLEKVRKVITLAEGGK